MKALLLAGGKGTRLYPYSATLPKSLMPVGDRPVMELILGSLRAAGVVDVVIAVNHLRHLIEAYFGDGSRFGLRIGYSVENTPLGTAGPMAAVLGELGEDFILANGDILTTLDIGAFAARHRDSGAAATIGTFEREHRLEFGLLDVGPDMNLLAYHEKPVQKYLVSMGIYVLNGAAVARHVRRGQYLDMPDLMLKMIAAGQTVHCARQDCLWLDIGRPDDFALAQRLVEEDPARFRQNPA